MPVVFTAATGTGVAVSKDRSLGQTVDDAKIATAIKAGLVKAGFQELYSKIKVEVVAGRVLYTGTVASEEDILHAVKIAWQQAGVREVANELQVDENSNHFDLLQYSKDSLSTAQIKTKLLGAKKVKSVNYTVITLDNVVYMFGIARSEAELKIATNIAARTRGIKRVVSYVEILKPEGVDE